MCEWCDPGMDGWMSDISVVWGCRCGGGDIQFSLTYFADSSLLAQSLPSLIPTDFPVPDAANGAFVSGYVDVSPSRPDCVLTHCPCPVQAPGGRRNMNCYYVGDS